MNESIVKLLRDRYFLSSENTWEELAKRISKIYPDIYPYLEQMKFIPSSPTLMNGGTNERVGTLSSCFPMDIEDSIEGIFESLKECAIVTKMGGGIGIPYFRLRGSKEEIKTLNGRTSSGPLPFIAIFNEMLDGVNQSGCLIGRSLISTQEGLLYLDEIISNRDYGWHDHSIKIDTENGIKDSKGFYCNGIASTLKIITEEGIELEGTYNHKIKIFSENGFIWKELQDVKKGDFAVIKLKSGNGVIQKLQQLDESRYNHFNENDISLPKEITEDFAFILGYLTGNGSVASKEKDYRIVFTIPLKSYLVEDFPKKLKKVFGDISFYTQRGKGDCVNITISNKKLKEFLILNKLNKSKSNTASIPLLIRKSPISIKGMYLRGLFESDGSVSHGYPQLNSSSFVLIKEVSAILFELGCPNSIFLTKHGKNCFSKEEFIHSLKILSYVGLENWKKIISCDEKSRFMECKNWKCDLTREKSYVLPFPRYWFSKVLEEIDKNHYKPESHKKLKKEIKRYFRNERNFSISSYQHLKEKKEFAFNLIPEVGDYFFSKVVKIEDTGENETYDINVEDVHSYIANGIVTHNSRRGAAMGLLTIDHPSILEFIEAKKNLSKFNRLNFSVMIPDSFYKDLEENPEIPHTIKNVTDGATMALLDSEGEMVTIKQLWDAIVENAWSVAEPGIFNMDIAYRQCTVTNINKTVISNPCITGDTLIAVADGRGSISIKQLVDEEKDVPVYTLDKQGDLRIKKFLNPRLTQKNADIYEVSFDSGLIIKCTNNHEFLTTSGVMVPLKDLKKGSSIKSIIKNYSKSVSKKKEYCTITTNGITKSEHRLIAAYFSGKLLSEGEVVHHINYDSLDNRPENLQIMDYKTHDQLHGKDKLGKNNPVFKIKDRDSWIRKQRELNQGLKNSNSKNISNEEIVRLIKKYSKNTLYNFFTLQMWKSLNLPLLNTNNKGNKYRYSNPKEYCDLAKVKYIESITYNKLLKQYNNLVSGEQIFKFDKKSLNFIIYKKCEYCGKEFIVDYDRRQITFCSHYCCVKEIQKPFMFENSKFSKKYLDHPNTKRRLKLTLEMFRAYKKLGNTYLNFGKEYKGARTVIRNNNIFCPSLSYLKDNINKVRFAKDLIYLAEKNIKNYKHKFELKKAIGDSYNHKIISIKYIGKEDVYDGTVEETHNFLIGGREYLNKKNKKCIEYVVCSNCSEFTNIPYTSCALGSINLSSLVEGKKFNWDEFEEIIVKATRFINSTIDKNKFPIKKIKEVTLKTRPIGLGVMGLAHALYKKEIPYNSDKAFKFTEEVIRYLTLRSMQESVELSKIEGSYEAFDYDLFIKANERFFKHKSCRNINIEELRSDIKKHGIRNSCCTSIAPTGSIAYIAEVSGGIEPVFALSYSRKIETGIKEGVKQYDVVCIGDSVFEKYLIDNFDDKIKQKILKEVSENKGSCQKCKDIPDDMKKVFLTAGDLTPMEHLSILEATAVNVSLSASKTINLPSNATKEDVAGVFLDAHKRGIIGVTVYRDGCREGILIHDSDKKDKIEGIVYRAIPKRPPTLPCEIHRVMYQGHKWIVFVSLMEGKPFEMFAGAVDDVCIPKKIEDGFIKRQGTKHYSFEYDDEVLINNIGKSFYNKEHDAFARSISLHLQSGVPLDEVLIMLNKAEGDVTHFAKVLARTLKKYVEDGLDAQEVCPTCGSKLRFSEGCLKCSDIGCGYSKCG